VKGQSRCALSFPKGDYFTR